MFVKYNVTPLEYELQLKAASLGISPKVHRYLNKTLEMEFLNSFDLYGCLNNPSHNTKEVAISCIKALKALHRLGIVHGDLHAQNLQVVNNKTFIIDYGEAKYSSNEEDFKEDLLSLTNTLACCIKQWLYSKRSDEPSDEFYSKLHSSIINIYNRS